MFEGNYLVDLISITVYLFYLLIQVQTLPLLFQVLRLRLIDAVAVQVNEDGMLARALWEELPRCTTQFHFLLSLLGLSEVEICGTFPLLLM